jgi:sigma-B regulation protein RsbU (phosphoserine phosphatase)
MNKVLIINKSDSIYDYIVHILTKNGFDVMRADNLSGVSSVVRFAGVDLVIIDSETREESGFDFCRRLKTMEETRYIPIMITGESETNSAVTRAIAAGADDFMPRGFDEMTLLSKTKALLRIKKLSDELKRHYAELERQNKLLDEQLNMAMRVQRSLIRDCDTKFNGISISSRYKPAIEIGGDFYDILRLGDEYVSIVIGDVSGHGISAALLTAMLNMMIRTLAPRYINPAEFLHYMNIEFNRVFENSLNSQMYASVFYAVINTKSKRVSYSNAGQTPPVFLNRDAGVVYELEVGGTPIGMMADPNYEQRDTSFADGDLVLFFTDGLPDNQYKENPDDFYDDLKRFLINFSDSKDATVILDEIMDVFHVPETKPDKKYGLDDVSVILCRM